MAMIKKKKKRFVNSDEDYNTYDDSYVSDDSYNRDDDTDNEYSPYGNQDDPDDYASPRASKKGKKRRKGNNKNSGGLTNVLIIVAAIAVIILLYNIVMGFVGPRRSECKELINEIQTSCNEMDVKGLVGCLDPKIKNKVMPILIGVEVLTQGDLQSVLRTIARDLGMDFDSDSDLEESFQTLKLNPVSYGLPLATRKVKCRAEVMGIERTIILSVKKKDGEAYLYSVKFKD